MRIPYVKQIKPRFFNNSTVVPGLKQTSGNHNARLAQR